jgi:methionyl-tRNA synthetase
MTTSSKRYTVTAALPYANGPVHIGHLAGAYLPADIYARYLRSTNQEVVFICGTDEHGVAITIQAQKESTTPQAIVDHYHKLIHQSFKDFNISFDVFSRTSNETHTKTAQEFFLKFHKDGKFKEIETEQEDIDIFVANSQIKNLETEKSSYSVMPFGQKLSLQNIIYQIF